MTDDQKTRITEYAKVINTNVVDGELLEFVVAEVADRVLLYLNDTEIPESAERIVARVVASVFNQTNNNLAAAAPEQSISQVTDNGQSVQYLLSLKKYFADDKDGDIFMGFESLLAPYRRPYVIAS